MDSGTHARATGRTNERILENARRLATHAYIAVRVPVVPGFNDTGENMEQAAELLSAFRRLVSVELLPCHALGAEKLAALGHKAGPLAAPRLAGSPSWQNLFADTGCRSALFMEESMADWIMRSAQAWFDKDEQATFYERFQYLQEAERLFESLAPAVRYGRTLSYILQRVSLPIRPRREAARRGGGAHPHGGTARGRGGGEAAAGGTSHPDRSRSRSCGTTPMAGSAGGRPGSSPSATSAWTGRRWCATGFPVSRPAPAMQPCSPAWGDPHKASFLEGALLCLGALSDYIRRYGEEAQQRRRRARNPRAVTSCGRWPPRSATWRAGLRAPCARRCS